MKYPLDDEILMQKPLIDENLLQNPQVPRTFSDLRSFEIILKTLISVRYKTAHL